MGYLDTRDVPYLDRVLSCINADNGRFNHLYQGHDEHIRLWYTRQGPSSTGHHSQFRIQSNHGKGRRGTFLQSISVSDASAKSLKLLILVMGINNFQVLYCLLLYSQRVQYSFKKVALSTFEGLNLSLNTITACSQGNLELGEDDNWIIVALF